MQPGRYANFQNQIEGIIRETQVMDIAEAGDDAIADSRFFRMFTRVADHGLDRIDGLNRIAELSQRHTGESGAAADFKDRPFGGHIQLSHHLQDGGTPILVNRSFGIGGFVNLRPICRRRLKMRIRTSLLFNPGAAIRQNFTFTFVLRELF